jgi:hypothetical protein
VLYLAIPAHNEVATIGVLLWRIRTVLAEFPREYEVVVYDDASTDETAEVAEQYRQAMPVTVLRGRRQVGYAGAVDALVRHVARHTRYPRRDALLLLQGDFTDPPTIIPEFARRFEGGADLVVGERHGVSDAPTAVRRLFVAARWALRPFVRVRSVQDLTGSMRLVRISVVRDLLRVVGDAPVCEGDSLTANAAFAKALVPHARRVEAVPVEPSYAVRMRETRRSTWRDALAVLRWGWQARGASVVPNASPESPESPERERPRRERGERERPDRERPDRERPDRERPDRERPDRQGSGRAERPPRGDGERRDRAARPERARPERAPRPEAGRQESSAPEEAPTRDDQVRPDTPRPERPRREQTRRERPLSEATHDDAPRDEPPRAPRPLADPFTAPAGRRSALNRLDDILRPPGDEGGAGGEPPVPEGARWTPPNWAPTSGRPSESDSPPSETTDVPAEPQTAAATDGVTSGRTADDERSPSDGGARRKRRRRGRRSRTRGAAAGNEGNEQAEGVDAAGDEPARRAPDAVSGDTGGDEGDGAPQDAPDEEGAGETAEEGEAPRRRRRGRRGRRGGARRGRTRAGDAGGEGTGGGDAPRGTAGEADTPYAD